MDTQRDKYLTEQVLGECWHEGKYCGHVVLCKHCNESMYYNINNDFSTSDGFFKLWNVAQKKGWWNELVYEITGPHLDLENLIIHINPDRFADAVYKFLINA